MVSERSAAEIPVVIPFAASTETVKAVRCPSLLRRVIGGRLSALTRSRVIGAQINPRPWVAMKAMISGVAREAAPMRSASFSLPGSSDTMTSLPLAMSATISSIELKVREDTGWCGRIGGVVTQGRAEDVVQN